MKHKDVFYLKENIRSESDQVEVYFCDSGYLSLIESELKKNTFYFFEKNFTLGDIKNVDIRIKIDKSKKVRIWSSRKNIYEYLGFLYFCYKFEGKNISVIFTDDYSPYVYTVGATEGCEIKELLKYEQKLNSKEIEEYKNEWIRLMNENGEMRLFKDRKVISVKYNYLDNYILKYLNKDNLESSIGALMANDNENNFSDSTFRFLIDRMVKRDNYEL